MISLRTTSGDTLQAVDPVTVLFKEDLDRFN